MIKYLFSTFTMLALAVSAGVPAIAADTTGSGNGQTLNASAQVSANSGRDGSDDGSDHDVNDDSRTGNDDSSHHTGSASSTPGSTDDSGHHSFSVLRADLSDEDSSQSQSRDSIKTSDDLDLYFRSVMHDDDHINSVGVGEDNSVDMDYKTEGRFLGFIPMLMHAKTHVNADGTVSISYPWYRFLVSMSNDDELRADIEARVAAWKDQMASTTVSASAQASLFDSIREAFAMRASTAAK
ncbi:MAG: Cell wall surface anchor family protein [Parcubacteria group bacterium]|nr:Cell wall surface anchor family protein [Parcubacteria group bacterium]